MHEFALAQAVVSATLSTAEAEGLAKVLRVDVHVGELQQIQLETFDHAITQVLPESAPRLVAAEFVVTIQPARLRCRVCDRSFTLAEAGEPDEQMREAIHFVPELAHAFLKCPGCSSPDFEIVSGRGVTIAHIEGERDE